MILLEGSNDAGVHEVYNTLLQKWLGKRKKMCVRVASELSDAHPLTEQVLYYSSIDEVASQFILCELSKMVKYTETRSVIYERGYAR